MSSLKNTRSLLYLSLFLFLGFGIFTILTPTFGSFAEEAKVSVGVESQLALTLSSDKVNMNITPLPGGNYTYGDLKATVSTNNNTGYVLNMAASGVDKNNVNTNALLNTTNSDYAIASIAGENRYGALVYDTNDPSIIRSLPLSGNNQWAYSMNDTHEIGQDDIFESSPALIITSHPIPLLSAPATIKSSDTPQNSQDTNVRFHAQVDNNAASGVYHNTMMFSAVANPVFNDEPVFGGITTMQQMTTAICESEPTPSAADTDVPTKTLTDTRDGKTYKISKLADGHCWMSQNLALGGDTPITLTPADSNVTSNWTLPAADTSWMASYTISHYWIDSANQATYGNYYNWPAAIAESGTDDIISDYFTSVVPADAPQSICPKGWRLPKGSDNGDFANLITTTYGISSNTAGFTKLQSVPLSFPLSGFYYSDRKIQGSSGRYWSSTAYNAYRAYYFFFDSSSVGPTDYAYDRYYGIPVRCLAE